MADIVVKVPTYENTDYDFLAFSFDGKHSYEDFHIYRISDGNDGYKENLVPNQADKTAEVPGMDGQYYFGTQHKNKVFNINFAFDRLTEEELGKLKKWLSTKDLAPLWFAEAPHKVYMAKVTGSATMTATAFSIDGEREYRGKGNIQFTSYCPYGRTPDIIRTRAGNDLFGGYQGSYRGFDNYEEIKKSLPLSEDNINNPYGDLPFSFCADLLSPFSSATSEWAIDEKDGGVIYTINNVTHTITEDGVLSINESSEQGG